MEQGYIACLIGNKHQIHRAQAVSSLNLSFLSETKNPVADIFIAL